MQIRQSLRWSVMLGMLVGSLAACAGERAEQTAQALQGECRTAFGSDVCSWGTMVGDDVTEFGVTIPLATVESAPAEGEMVFPPTTVAVVPLPERVASATGFTHLGLNWEPHGHPPALFLTPHFDFHFYTIDPEQVGAIDCADVRKPAMLPAAYTLPDVEIPGLGELVGLCVPNMGMHAMLEEELDDTDPFGASMLVGYYGQELVFLEPMIARAELMEAQSFTMDVPLVRDPGPNVRWPTSFEALYDDSTRSYRFVFAGISTE